VRCWLAATPVTGGEIRSWRGEVLYEVPAGVLEKRYGVSIGLHRAALQTILLSALPDDAVRLDAECVGFEQDAAGVTVGFAGGREERGELLIGADGLNSTIRAQLFGNEKPRYAGYTAWRGVVEAGEEEFARGGTGFESWGRGTRFGLLNMGQGRLYWFATANTPEGEERGANRKEEVLGRFRRWHQPSPQLIRATEESSILRNDVYDREPVKRWGEGRVTLLGDAAHPTTPNLGQGACQAMEDAVVLAGCLKEQDSVAALRLYEARRANRTAFVVRRSRLVGRIGQLENPLLCRLRDALMKTAPLRAQLWQLDPIVGYEV
jgi:2-polyprenyl-6-methoxyphenol hydroxylase-like FAD-dependent oxidoreductase